MLQLIPGADEAASNETLFAIDRMKAGWRPGPAHLRTRSFPTPFAQAEMMAHVLGMLQLMPGARQPRPEIENPRLEQTYERWRLLVLGVATGALEIESVDLRAPAARRFGAMLNRVRPEAPFLPVLRAVDTAGIQSRRLVAGGGDPWCMFWCSPRLGSYIDHAGTYWNVLKSRVDANPDVATAMQMLADWRESLRANGYWSPGDDRSPAWMRALEVLLAGTRDTGGHLLARDARWVGPIRLAVPSRTGTGHEEITVYLPTYHPKWAERFSELLFFRPVARESTSGVVDLVDPTNRPIASVRMAAQDATPGMELLSGVGHIVENTGAPRIHGSTYWLDDQPKARGYRSMVFDPLLAAAARSHRRTKVDERQILANPILFPDALRLLVQRPALEEEEGGARITLTRAVTSRVKSGDGAPQSGTRLARWTPDQPLPRVLAIPATEHNVATGLVESFGPANKSVDVGEIRGLGFVLWLCFLGEATLRADGQRIVWTSGEEQELLGRSVLHDVECPLEIYRDALACVHAEAERTRARDRLATLQRFYRTWSQVGAGLDETGEELGLRLGRIAAETFVRWVWEGPERLALFGGRGARVEAHYTLHTDLRLPLFVDAYARWG